jgi:hypothetical protein
MKRLANTEAKISKLESELSNLRLTASYGTDCTQIAKIELQLSMLYNQSGNKPKADELVEEAQKTLNDPLCQSSRDKLSMLRYIESYKSNPRLATVGSMPAIYRYLSMIVLLGGYLGLYLASTTLHMSSNDYLVGILAIFVLSIIINFAVRASYTRKVRAQQ